MENKYLKLLYDINQSISNIEEYIEFPRIFEIYDSNSMLQDAVERNLEIIGEAIRKLLIIKPDISIKNARKIVNTRNKISHGYDEIENSEIWNIVINHLPVLKEDVEKLLIE